MRRSWRLTAIGMLIVGMMLALGTDPGAAQSRAHVYLLRGLMNIFSLGMDTLTGQLNRNGVYATVHGYGEWQSLADRAAADFKAGKEGPIILVGHSLGADAVMEMAAYLGRKGIPVAMVVPFDGTQSFAASDNVARVLNLTQRNYAYMRRGPGFHGTLANVDVSSDPNIDHINIDKSP
ncbi:MAG TPA: thioesterase domain-containing protein, partial [Xanthobacteraceae bacterium]